MEQSYIFDFCTLYNNMEQAKDLEHYQQQQRNNNKVY